MAIARVTVTEDGEYEIEPVPAAPRYLRNVGGLGYRFDG